LQTTESGWDDRAAEIAIGMRLIPGSTVWIRQRRWRVERVERYRPLTRVVVSDAGERRAFLAPFDRIVPEAASARPRRARPQATRHRLLSLVARSANCRSLNSLVGATVTPLAYQVEPALALLGGARRVLVADEVGLGKTIQASLALSELRRFVRALTAMVLVPAALRDQWKAELKERFDIAVEVLDLDRLRNVGPQAADRWPTPGVWLASLDFLKQPHVAQLLSGAIWDLLVIDEAHVVSGDSVRHELAVLAASRARRLMLLTATPHSGDDQRFGRLMSLGALPVQHDEVVAFRRTRTDVGWSLQQRVRWHGVTPSAEEREAFAALGRFERAVLDGPLAATAPLLLSVFRKRALSTMAALALSVERRLAWLQSQTGPVEAVQLPLFLEEQDDLSKEVAALRLESGLGTGSERGLLERTLRHARRAARHSSKLSRILSLLHHTSDPLILFTEFRESLEALASVLGSKCSTAVLHGGQSEEERRRELARFSNGDARLLLATDVASQGLNLQHRARWIVNLELPWNPVRLEQRIGRVSRIGQTRPVHATILVGRHSAESSVLRNLVRRTVSLRRAMGRSAMESIVPPHETEIAAAIFGCSRLELCASSRPLFPNSTRWRRVAAVLTKGVYRRRAWLDRVGAEGQCRGRPLWTKGRAPLRIRHSGMLVSIALATTDGVALERQLLILDVPHARPSSSDQRLLGAVRTIGSLRSVPRVRRLERWLRARSDREHAIDAAIADNWRRTTPDVLRQPTLFVSKWTMETAREGELADGTRAAKVEAAEPVVEIIWIGDQ
jgi:superfamily II DNA or RNA helicase